MRWIFFIVIFLMTACTNTDDQTIKEVDMLDANGDKLGTATLKEDAEGVLVELKLEGLEPGWHGIHVHESPSCEPPDFASAGNHFDPPGNEHGLMNPSGPHVGDLPNVEADGSGKVEEELTLPEATLLDGKNSLLREEGTSLILHSDPDDGYSQPSGNSGERILCGEIRANE
jgi:Cu-Zn family superoxide dismutase